MSGSVAEAIPTKGLRQKSMSPLSRFQRDIPISISFLSHSKLNIAFRILRNCLYAAKLRNLNVLFYFCSRSDDSERHSADVHQLTFSAEKMKT
jgi:hypothetical protein